MAIILVVFHLLKFDEICWLNHQILYQGFLVLQIFLKKIIAILIYFHRFNFRLMAIVILKLVIITFSKLK